MIKAVVDLAFTVRYMGFWKSFKTDPYQFSYYAAGSVLVLCCRSKNFKYEQQRKISNNG